MSHLSLASSKIASQQMLRKLPQNKTRVDEGEGSFINDVTKIWDLFFPSILCQGSIPKGPFMNAVMQILTVFNPPPPFPPLSCTYALVSLLYLKLKVIYLKFI